MLAVLIKYSIKITTERTVYTPVQIICQKIQLKVLNSMNLRDQTRESADVIGGENRETKLQELSRNSSTWSCFTFKSLNEVHKLTSSKLGFRSAYGKTGLKNYECKIFWMQFLFDGKPLNIHQTRRNAFGILMSNYSYDTNKFFLHLSSIIKFQVLVLEEPEILELFRNLCPFIYKFFAWYIKMMIMKLLTQKHRNEKKI